MSTNLKELQAELTRMVCAAIEGATDVDNLHRLSGGASQETWSLDAITPGASVPLILRRAVGGVESEKQGSHVTLEIEARLIELAGKFGVVVPIVHRILEPGDGIGAGFLMNRIERLRPATTK